MASARQFPGDGNFAADTVGVLFENFELDEAVVDEDDTADFDVVNQVGVIDGDRTDSFGTGS